jgi:hypothetical protein
VKAAVGPGRSLQANPKQVRMLLMLMLNFKMSFLAVITAIWQVVAMGQAAYTRTDDVITRKAALDD